MPLAVGQALAAALLLKCEDAEVEMGAAALLLAEAQGEGEAVPEGLLEALLQVTGRAGRGGGGRATWGARGAGGHAEAAGAAV